MGEAEVEFMKRVAVQVAVAVDNALNFEAAQAYQKQLARARLKVPLEINNLLISSRDVTALFKGIAPSLKPVLQRDYTSPRPRRSSLRHAQDSLTRSARANLAAANRIQHRPRLRNRPSVLVCLRERKPLESPR